MTCLFCFNLLQPCFDPKILVKDGSEKETISSKEDKRDLLSNIVLDNNSDLF